MYQSSTPYSQSQYRGAPVAGPMNLPYNGAPPGYNPAMQYKQQPQRYTSVPQPQPPTGGFRQPHMPQQQYTQQYPGQSYPQQRGDTGRPHKGTLPPGQMVRVGQHAVRVERYLSEGGYAHVYLTSSEKPVYPPKRSNTKGRWGEKGYTTHCLKRIAFEDESVWRDVSREIEVMKALPPNPHLIQYLDSSHHRLSNGTYEVFILMEFCSGGGIIDLLNKRLRDRLKEIEILNIFTDVCEAVAAMHAMSRPLLHRDLKIENVLSHPNSQPPTPQRPTPLIFKLCDFGSTTFPATHPPQNLAEAEALAQDLNKHTTLQYRSPEMVEPLLGWAVGLPSDVWALGVLLYKLCYYTTPFEEHGTLAIVNAKYTFPQYPVYSPRLQHLIASMLVEQPSRRPTVFEVLRAVHDMSGTRSEVDYPMPNRQLPVALPSSPKKPKSSANLLDFTAGGAQTSQLVSQPPLVTSVQPQRRGRPTRPESMKATAAEMAPPPQLPTPHIPKMPVPASTTGPTNMEVTGEREGPAHGVKLQHAVSLSRRTASGTKPPKPVLARLQGSAFNGGSADQSPQFGVAKGSVDAFGMSKNQAAASPGGFGDSFSAPTPPPKDAPKDAVKRTGSNNAFGVSTTGDAFGMPAKNTGQKVMSPTGFGDSFGTSFGSAGVPPPTGPKPPKPTRTFTDSFSVSPPTSAKVTPSATKVLPASTKASPGSPKVTPPSPQKSGHSVRPPSASSTLGRSPDATSPSSDMSFEQRFPSLEAITREEEKSNLSKSPSPPVQSQRMAHRQSISIANLTGGHLSKASRLSSHGQVPHPRSTHVTGTAFKNKEESLKPPATSIDSSSPTADYLSMLDDEVEMDALKPTEDLFGGNDESLSVALAPLQPILSNRSSGSRFGVSPTAVRPPPPTMPKPLSTPNKPQGAAQRATLPDMPTQRPTTNFNSANWSPLQTMKTTPPPAEVDSSDDEPIPESAEATTRRPVSPTKSGSRQHPPSPSIAHRVAAYQQQATTGPSTSPPKPGYGTWSGRGTARMARPQSMFDVPRSNSPGKLSPPLVSVRSGSPVSGGSGRSTPVGHSRRSSINDIVSRYEALTTSPAKETGFPSANGSGRASRPPVIANKPPGLVQRRPSGPRVPRAAPPTQPKPASLREASGTSVESDKPKKEPKPDEKEGQENAAPSWRAPSKADIASKPPTLKPKMTETLAAVPGSPGSSRSSSPEKQQPVNLLIQRWNKGELKHR
ncbi:uncharacterized protein CcaverHIS019_0402420 [Cutaneotrichosporon cavernicola]|uniref:Protein kinase domain-containing protein n=1 Tax=Cutaneotrichosporon cavernicola TaxID=279322 RepID=A0AA48L3S4_9TREE|nr:uncharacterized protein CcaverHIS019_0402420 [Cutaneotrichosporon cavernicola]BEI91422.1 hypothetical protein CcaverHIS019_0402420 [Cutaneotrichosporon cavernicola]